MRQHWELSNSERKNGPERVIFSLLYRKPMKNEDEMMSSKVFIDTVNALVF